MVGLGERGTRALGTSIWFELLNDRERPGRRHLAIHYRLPYVRFAAQDGTGCQVFGTPDA